MTPLPAALGGDGAVRAHRLDRQKYAEDWEAGEGAFQVGGRWNPIGVRAIYCALDPATAILEVAVHKGFAVLDAQPHIMTSFTVADPSRITVVRVEDLPDPTWLDPYSQSPERRAWGKDKLRQHRMLVMPSAVSRLSWNLIVNPPLEPGWCLDVVQEPFVLDPRLNEETSA
ncbi:MAG: RES domain-containing protein [Pseudomonadota bacterium]